MSFKAIRENKILMNISEFTVPILWLKKHRSRKAKVLEGWHRRISSILGQSYPNTWNFLEFLKESNQTQRPGFKLSFVEKPSQKNLPRQ